VATLHRDGAGRTTIVVGFDGSDSAWRALWWACGEARRLAGRAIAVYVTCATHAAAATAALATGFDAGAYALAREQCNAERAAALNAELVRATADLDVEVRFVHLRGSPAEQLPRIARDTHADVIAVGRSTKLRHQLAGSLGHGLSRNRRAPIVVIVP
jgi:nucleotide-binding universal stress UspA family protein